MKLYYPDFYKDFRCLAGSCPDSCCRQGWQIVVDESHLRSYIAMPGALGEQVRNTLTTNEDGETVLRMENNVCALLRPDGLCPIAAELGEDSLCSICHTHPRFIEEYGGTREIHFSLSCPEAARLSLRRTDSIRFLTDFTDEEISCPNSIDPDEYLTLLKLRELSLSLAQDKTISVYDRMALLLQLARRIQPLMDHHQHEACRSMMELFPHRLISGRMLTASKRLRLKGASWFPERELLLSLEHLTAEFPALVRDGVFTARDGSEFDRCCHRTMEHLLTLWLSHYILKAVNDGRADTKIRFCVFLCMTVRRLCLCSKSETPDNAAMVAGLLAKELEHSEENRQVIFSALEHPQWHEHLMMQLPTAKKGDRHAI